MIIISDTSVITNLAAIGQLDLLQKLYNKILIPQAVYQELTGIDITVPGSLEVLGDIYLFKFTDELQSRFEELLEKKKADSLTPEEEAEYVGISELQRIFTLINAQIASKSKWCPNKIEEL